MRRLLDRIPYRGALGLATLFSGAALLGTILLGISLPLALAVTGAMLLLVIAVTALRADPEQRTRLRRTAAVGIIAGLLATVAYDGAKWLLSQVDPSPYNPFEATEIFGLLLLGDGADRTSLLAAGIGYHVLNGTTFGVAFTILFGAYGALSVRAAVLRGIAWGLFLELFQLTLYPGWLDIRFYEEFAAISFLSHVVYGVALGLVARALLRRWVYDPYEI
jgi:hypothetical protein